MVLELDGITKKVGGQHWLYSLNLAPPAGAVTVLLGATQAGKTSLMRIMAGLDSPSHGQVLVDGQNVVGVPVRQRNVAMVYQQFINYPSMNVRDNIASPLKLRGVQDHRKIVDALAEKLHIHAFLDRYPGQLSGGQQQRVALARALAKGAPLVLLDEPLVNLDYKLREELREELSVLFSVGDSTVIYATTEPSEALLLGGYTAVLDAGQLLQFGKTAEVFHRPMSLRVARAFSDPPMNLLPGVQSQQRINLASHMTVSVPDLPAPTQAGQNGEITLGVRASALRVTARPEDVFVAGKIELVEISGSDTFVHLSSAIGPLVAQLTGVHSFEMDSNLTLYFDPNEVFVFDSLGALMRAPARRH
jgi:glycerol transport system ATP-binding protein